MEEEHTVEAILMINKIVWHNVAQMVVILWYQMKEK